MKLYLLRGLPGSGKSTLARHLGHAYFEADQYFVNEDQEYVYDQSKISAAHTWCQRAVESRVNAGFDTVVSNTSTTIRELRPYFEIAFKHGILPTVILCQNQFHNVHDVPQEALDRMKNRFCYDILPLFKEYEEKLQIKE